MSSSLMFGVKYQVIEGNQKQVEDINTERIALDLIIYK